MDDDKLVVGNITIHFIKYDKKDPTTDISRQEYYNRTENKGKSIILTNGSHKDPSAIGEGTQKALRLLNLGLTAEPVEDEKFFNDDTIGPLQARQCNIVYSNKVNLKIEQKFDLTKLGRKDNSLSPFFGSIISAYVLKNNIKDFRSNIKAVYHILGLDVRKYGKELDSIGIVVC